MFAIALPFLGGIGLPELISLVLFAVVPIWLLWKVFARVGMPGAYALLILVPGLGWVIALWLLAFGKWPALETMPSA